MGLVCFLEFRVWVKDLSCNIYYLVSNVRVLAFWVLDLCLGLSIGLGLGFVLGIRLGLGYSVF